jgi:hypothetical protein
MNSSRQGLKRIAQRFNAGLRIQLTGFFSPGRGDRE